MMAVLLGKLAGARTGIRQPIEDEDFPEIVFRLPHGEVAWPVPKEHLFKGIYNYKYREKKPKKPCEDVVDRQKRIRKWFKNPTLGEDSY